MARQRELRSPTERHPIETTNHSLGTLLNPAEERLAFFGEAKDLTNGIISHHAAVGDYALTDG